jgi:hypothetical protein
MEPDHNIIHPLAYHFSRRLRAQHWFLYDVRRRTAARWNQGTLQFGAIEQFTAPALSDDEKKRRASGKPSSQPSPSPTTRTPASRNQTCP